MLMVSVDSSGNTSRTSVFKGRSPEDLATTSGTRLSQEGCVPHSQYHFIKSDSFSHVSSDDIGFLKSQGAFLLPDMPFLDEFIQEYFRHVHPHLPLIDEAAFWEAFHSNGLTRGLNFQISVFTFQAMLFASCNVS